MRRLALALVVFCLYSASGVRAELVTSFATGPITFDMYSPSPSTSPYLFEFTPGATVQLAYSYDPARVADTLVEGLYDITGASSFEIATSDGFSLTYPRAGTPFYPSHMRVRDGDAGVSGTGDGINVLLGPPSASLMLTFSDPTGETISSTGLPTSADFLRFPTVRMSFMREFGFGSDGFHANLVPVSGSAAAIPEPSSVAAAGLMTLAALGYARRRRKRAA